MSPKLDQVSLLRLLKRYLINDTWKMTLTIASNILQQIPSVDIDPKGRFKYILISVTDPETKAEKTVVRGYKSCAYHMDILEKVEPALLKQNLLVKCLGGGRILHKPEAKSILVYGYSQGYGRADHTIAHKLLKEKFPDYQDIDWSNEGY